MTRRTAWDCAPAAWRSCRRHVGQLDGRHVFIPSMTTPPQLRRSRARWPWSTEQTRLLRLRAASNARCDTPHLSLACSAWYRTPPAAVGRWRGCARLSEVSVAGPARVRSGCRAPRRASASAPRRGEAAEYTWPGAGWQTVRAPCAAAAAPAQAPWLRQRGVARAPTAREENRVGLPWRAKGWPGAADLGGHRSRRRRPRTSRNLQFQARRCKTLRAWATIPARCRHRAGAATFIRK